MKVYLNKELVEIEKADLKDLVFALLDEEGREVQNPSPTVIHTGLNRPPTLKEQIQRVLHTTLSEQAAMQELETFEESNDFEVDEDPSPTSKYELMEEEVPSALPSNDQREALDDGGPKETDEGNGQAPSGNDPSETDGNPPDA